jgi:hypothetical protein
VMCQLAINTGAAVTLIKEDVIAGLPITPMSSPLYLRSVSGHDIEVLGTALVPFVIDHNLYTYTCIVCPKELSIIGDGLIGLNFLED